MKRSNLLNGKKNELISVFKELRHINGKAWPKLLRKHDTWYDTSAGTYAWSNAIRVDGSVGNETLRRIISDMQTIIANDRKRPLTKRLGFSKPKSIHS